MGVYTLGTEVEVDETFSISDVPTNPTTVTFTLIDPNGNATQYIFGTDVEVTNPSVGKFLLTILPPIAGLWQYFVAGTGAVQATSEVQNFTVMPSGTDLSDAEVITWIDAQDVMECCSAEIGSDTTLLQMAIAASVELLYEASGRQFAGIRQRTVRPCRTDICRFGDQVLSRGHLVEWDGSRWGSYECGCQHTSRVKLAGNAKRIVQVKIDGSVIDPSEYYLQQSRWLIRRSPDRWPHCQTIGLPDTEAGTWSVTYIYGRSAPMAAQLAAAALACETVKACTPGAECVLPPGATRVTRAGITFERSLFTKTRLSRGDRTLVWSTGIGAVDMFLNTVNPNGIQRRATFWSASPSNRYARPNPK